MAEVELVRSDDEINEDEILWKYYRKCLLAVIGHLPEAAGKALGDALYPSDEAMAEDALNRLRALDPGKPR